jgi:hypothetical protein
MTTTKKILAWCGVTVGLAAAASLIIVATVVDLATAARVGTIVGAIVGLAAFGLSVYSLLRSTGSTAQGSSKQSVDKSTIEGGNIQVGHVGGSFRKGSWRDAPTSGDTLPPGHNSAEPENTSQSVRRSNLSGGNIQAGTVGKDVDIEEGS